jgi:hypothetical protein
MVDKIMKWFWQFWNQWLKYRYVDPAVSLARLLVTLGAGLMAPGGVWWLLVALEIKPESLPVSLTVSIGPDTITFTGVFLLLVGVSLGIWGIRRVKKTRSSCLIYFRGLPGMHDQPPLNDLPPKFRYGEVSQMTLNTAQLAPANVLENIELFGKMLNEKIISMDTDAPYVVFAGLAPVPFLYASGVKISNRANLITMDYNRFEQSWHTLDEPDDHENVEIKFPEQFADKEIAIAMPFTLQISESQIPENLRSKTIWINLNKKGPRTDAISNSEKLNRILRSVHDLIRNFRGREGYSQIEKIHLFIAAQASTVFKLGTTFQPNVYPIVQIYHYDATKGEYSWHICVSNNSITLCEN